MECTAEKFGDFIAGKRIEKGISLRRMAKLVGLSAPYWNDIEKNRKNPPELEKLNLIADILNMGEEERTAMYDLAGSGRDTIGPDILAYVKENDYITNALRAARDLGANKDDWEKFIKDIEERKRLLPLP